MLALVIYVRETPVTVGVSWRVVASAGSPTAVAWLVTPVR